MSERAARGRIGPWRLLDMAIATMPLRMSLMGGGGGSLPEYGPPDSAAPIAEREDELPGSNIAESEQQGAIARERSRRWMVARGEESRR